MKGKKIFFIFMVIPLIINSVSLLFLPDKIPTHYNFKGQVDRWGSKYESLILAFIILILGFLFLFISKKTGKNKGGANDNEKGSILIFTISLLVLNVINIYFLYTSFKTVENISDFGLKLRDILGFSFGIMFILIGYVMSKIKRNFIRFGIFRNIKNEFTWRKSQRFCGLSSMVLGILLILGVFAVKNDLAYLLFAFFVTITCIMISMIYLYSVYKKYED